MNSTPPATLGRDEVIAYLREVGAILHEAGLQADIHVVGGAAMALVFDARRVTRDVDAAIRSHGPELYEAAAIVAQRHNLPPDWINSRAAAFMSSEDDGDGDEFNFPGLRVAVSSPEHLLAMKLRALRQRDLDDLVVLFRVLHIQSPGEAAEIHDRLFGEADIGYAGADEALYAAQMVFDYAERTGQPITAPEPHLAPEPGGPQFVAEYRKQDGTPVSAHWRKPPRR